MNWRPEGFDDYPAHFPRTPTLAPDPDRAWSARFAEAWREGPAAAADSFGSRASHTTIVCVRGFLGHYMPGYMWDALRALRRAGFDALLARNSPVDTVSENVERIAADIAGRQTRERLVFCGHSRGGLESLTLLAWHPSLASRCDGVALSQTPRGSSRIMESVLQRRHAASLRGARRRAAEVGQRVGVTLLGARRAGSELTSPAWHAAVERVSDIAWQFPVLQTASWSSTPTTWLESFHARLHQIAPGRAHDGQFFLDELIWPGLPHVLLPEVDHAQPAMGGHGFDSGLYWLCVLRVLFAVDSVARRAPC
ncbi:MAG: hypothetical protein ABJD07_17485 [Gemmatimonadaceae bacterium]